MKLCIFGGVGSGKSVALKFLEQAYGAEIIGMDETAHALYEPGREGWKEVIRLLGEGVLKEDRTLDRGRMADILYRDPELMKRLNSVIHPLVYAEVDRRLKNSAAELTVVETALPSGDRSADYDERWYVYTPAGVRKERLMRDRGYTAERVAEIMGKQPPDEAYAKLSDWILVNDGTPEELRIKIAERLEGKVKML